MGTNHMGRQSIRFPQPPVVRGFASVAGKKEREGPLGDQFTATVQDTTFGEKSWEQAERRMQQMTLELALEKAGLTDADLDAAFAGDLLNQCIGSSFSLRNRGVPTLGLYGACSTMAESLLLAAMSVSGGFARTALAMTSSHFASSERQYRFPLGYGGQRTPTSQWTVTGAGAVLLGGGERGIRITAATIGSIVDRGICDANNMGAAMAPAAFATLRAHFDDLHCAPEDYDRNRHGRPWEARQRDSARTSREGRHPRRRAGLRRDDLRCTGGRTCTAAAPAAGAAPPFCAGRCFPVWSGASCAACCSAERARCSLRCPPSRASRSLPSATPSFWKGADMDYLKAFLVGGLLCVIGQILIDRTKLTPARILVAYVVAGVLLGAVGLYDKLVDFAGAGATVPLTGFGNTLARGVKKAVDEDGALGILTGGLTASAAGITAAVHLRAACQSHFQAEG